MNSTFGTWCCFEHFYTVISRRDNNVMNRFYCYPFTLFTSIVVVAVVSEFQLKCEFWSIFRLNSVIVYIDLDTDELFRAWHFKFIQSNVIRHNSSHKWRSSMKWHLKRFAEKSEVFVLTLGSGNQSKVGQFVQRQIEIQGRINLNFGNV